MILRRVYITEYDRSVRYVVCAGQGVASATAKVSVCSLESEQLTIRLPLTLGLPLKMKEPLRRFPTKRLRD